MIARLCLLVSLILTVVNPLLAEESKSATEFANLEYRSIGPATGGRVARVTGVPGDPYTYYAATAAGGVWKSEDGGISFKPIFDDQPVHSIGSIAVAPSDPNVVYVGTGEANIRGNVAAGAGIFKSTDAGKTWKHVWNHVGQIGAIIVHPKNPDVAFAAVLGHAFGPNQERGVYRTQDGGFNWERVLFVNVDAGASDVCFDPNNPRILFAGTWQARRRPWEMTSGGPGSGLHVSRDGGDTWEKIGPEPANPKSAIKNPKSDKGLPPGPYGKVCVVVAASDSKRVYAMIEAEKGGLYRSDDGGDTWKLASDSKTIRKRPWYFSIVTVDPANADIVWVPQVPLMKSIDGGKNFSVVKGTHHADHHDCWIDPKNPKRMIVCNDGGVDITTNGGKTWYAPPLPIAQFYHIACDSSVPYRVLGCMQDQGTASGPSNSLSSAGILLGDWYTVGGGEAGYAVPDPANPNIVYAGEYSGIITRYDHRTRQARHIGAYPFDQSGHGGEEMKYRFQWTAPILVSRHDPRVVYHAANVLFRTRDGGQTWDKISIDLTRDDKQKQRWSGGPITGDNTGVEVYCTIFALAESPRDPKVLWTGSDDGLVHVSRDGGLRWVNVTPNIPDLPDWGTVRCIEASTFDTGTAYLVVDAHRLDNYHPYVWKTTDYGATWKKLTEELERDVYCHVVREDPKRKGLLYLGTERQVMVSHNDGESWQPLRLNIPTVAVHDLVVKDNDLVVGTMGRGIWIFDDLTPIREWTPAIGNRLNHLFAIQPAVRWRYHDQVSDHQKKGKGDNPPHGAVISYYLKDKPKKPLTIEVLDASNKRVIFIDGKEGKPADDRDWTEDPPLEPSKPEIPAEKGVNRFEWNLTHAGGMHIPNARIDDGNPTKGPTVAPGIYTIKITVDGRVITGKVDVRMDPRVTEPRGASGGNRGFEVIDIQPREADPKSKTQPQPWLTRETGNRAVIAEAIEQEKLALQIRDNLSKLAEMVLQIRALRKQLDLQAELLADETRARALLKEGKGLRDKLDKLEGTLHNPKAEVSYDILAQKGGAKLYSQLGVLYDYVKSGDGPPTQGMVDYAIELEKELERYTVEFDLVKKIDLGKVNDLARKAQAPIIWIPGTKQKK
jgi:photosystem II stability/assembly factor-like uncharacterized protein